MITPHKGGRTEFQSGFRLTPIEKADLKKVLTVREMSLADWVSEKVAEELPAIVGVAASIIEIK